MSFLILPEVTHLYTLVHTLYKDTDTNKYTNK